MKSLISILVLFTFVGCATTGTRTTPAGSAPEVESARLTNGVHWMRNSAEYQALMLQTYALAADRLRELVADKAKGSWAVASDADETILDNSAYAKELSLNRQATTDAKWADWVARQAAPPLPGAIDFLELVHRLGGRIAVVTNRKAEHCADTMANFRAFDIPFDVILCREEDRRKEPRWEMVETGRASAELPPLEIVLWLGDNIEDFPGFDQSVRFEEPGTFAEFGERFFVMPNPTYGSWSENPHE